MQTSTEKEWLSHRQQERGTERRRVVHVCVLRHGVVRDVCVSDYRLKMSSVFSLHSGFPLEFFALMHKLLGSSGK